MGKTQKALKRAEEQYRKRLLRATQTPCPKGMPAILRRASIRRYIDRYADIKTNLLDRNFDGSIKNVLFINTSNGSESTRHALNFGASLAENLNLKVLLVNLNLRAQSLHEVFRIDHILALSDLFSHSNKMVSPIKKVGTGNLYSVSFWGDHSDPEDSFESDEFEQFLKNMGKKFDYLIIDAPAITSFQECHIICSKVDAAVLVLESGNIADQVAVSAKKYFDNPANKFLGIVINKTRTNYNQLFKVASSIMAVCLIFTFGLFLGNGYLSVTSRIKNVPNRSGKLAGPTQPKHHTNKNMLSDNDHDSVPQERINTETKVAREQIHESPKEVNLPIDTIKEKSPTIHKVNPLTMVEPILNPRKGSDTNNRIKDRKERNVVVERGETLFRIIYRNYGTYNENIVRLILHENPKILSPSYIVVGQAIKLPEINQLY